jgi:hypothetical protein
VDCSEQIRMLPWNILTVNLLYGNIPLGQAKIDISIQLSLKTREHFQISIYIIYARCPLVFSAKTRNRPLSNTCSTNMTNRKKQKYI